MRYIAFLRGINLGKRRLPMTKLRVLFEELAFTEVETFIASGNVIFSASTSSNAKAKLESQIAAHLQSSLGYAVDTFVRTVPELRRIAGANPFPKDIDPGYKIHVAFLQSKLPAATARQLEGVETDYDRFKVHETEFYWLTRGPMSQSKVWTLPEVKRIKLPTCTMRNMTSIRKLAAKVAEGGKSQDSRLHD